MRAKPKLLATAAAIEMVLMDVDGVLTRGGIAYTSDDAELKEFNVKDGLGISKAVRAGLQLGIITARESSMVSRRVQELGIQHVFQKHKTKLPVLEKICEELSIPAERVLYVGDDLPDIPVLEAVGLAACPADAATEVQETCHLISKHNGGAGAVREILEFVLEAKSVVSAKP